MPIAVFLMVVGKSSAVNMKVTLKAAETKNLALSTRMAKNAVPEVMKAAAMQQMPGMNWVTKNSGFLPHLSMTRGRMM